MKKYLALIAAFWALTTAGGIPESHLLTPDLPEYIVSFDMNTTEKLNVTIMPPKIRETGEKVGVIINELYIKGERGTANISIRSYDHEMEIGPSEIAFWLYWRDLFKRELHCNQVDGYREKIDGLPAVLIIGAGCPDAGKAVFVAQYFRSKYLSCDIFSTFPFDEGTRSLLKTVHIEEAHPTKRLSPVSCCWLCSLILALDADYIGWRS